MDVIRGNKSNPLILLVKPGFIYSPNTGISLSRAKQHLQAQWWRCCGRARMLGREQRGLGGRSWRQQCSQWEFNPAPHSHLPCSCVPSSGMGKDNRLIVARFCLVSCFAGTVEMCLKAWLEISFLIQESKQRADWVLYNAACLSSSFRKTVHSRGL